jgi:hypothetical protein
LSPPSNHRDIDLGDLARGPGCQSGTLASTRGLSVDIRIAPGSEELRNGRYQIVHTAVDNAVAKQTGRNLEVVALP